MRLTEAIIQLIFRALSKISIRIILYNNQNIIHIIETKIMNINYFFKIIKKPMIQDTNGRNYAESWFACLYIPCNVLLLSQEVLYLIMTSLFCYLLTNHILLVTSYYHRRREIRCHVSQTQSCSFSNYTCNYRFLFLHYFTTLWRHGALFTKWQSIPFFTS